MRQVYAQSVSSRRRGFAAVLAMLFMVLFSVMALGLYSAATVSSQVSYNDSHNMRSLTAAESGMHFLRYHLDSLDIPYGQWDTQTTFNMVASQLHAKLDGTANMRDASDNNYCNPTTGTNPAGSNVLYIPGRSGTGSTAVQHWMPLDASSSCYITITQASTNLVVKVVGRFGNAASNPDRAIQLTYNPAENNADIFSYGVASKSAVGMNGNVSITGTAGHLDNGSVLSTTAAAVPLNMSGGPSISGDFAYTNTAGRNNYGNGTIAGMTPSNANFSSHVKLLSKAPDFPVIDTTVFKQSVTTWNNPPSSGSVYTNVKLPPGNYSLNNATINGILYVMQPNNIRFGGNTTINGMIVVDNTTSGTFATNIINFQGGVTSNTMASITNAGVLAQLTAAEKALTGAFLLAPNFSVTFGGNFRTVNGTIVADQMAFSGNAQGTIQGTIVNMKDSSVTFSGNNTITIASQGTTNYPAGVYFGSHYKPAPDTYAEVHP